MITKEEVQINKDGKAFNGNYKPVILAGVIIGIAAIYALAAGVVAAVEAVL